MSELPSKSTTSPQLVAVQSIKIYWHCEVDMGGIGLIIFGDLNCFSISLIKSMSVHYAS